jgi:hypothetical protein
LGACGAEGAVGGAFGDFNDADGFEVSFFQNGSETRWLNLMFGRKTHDAHDCCSR